jgi:outer membrane protein assembly factor BamB
VLPVESAQSRVALTYDGGIYVLDGETLELEADLPLDGFNRLNAAGDGRHALVTTAEGFQVLDLGTWTDSSGDHTIADPQLTDLVFEADTAGHVVRHGEKTILFADGTGDITIYNTDALLESTDTLPETEVVTSEAAHHGVAIELEDGTLLSTLGTSESRSGIRVLDASREEIARSEDCPSVHGEGAAANEIAVFGCSDGVLVYDAGVITKIAAEDSYGRTGNQYVSETSPITVGDYNSDPDSEGYLLTELVLTDTVATTSTVVDMPEGIGYTWRDVARGPNDEALILGSDGALHVLDVETGEFTESFPVIDAWESPVEWQDAHPALVVVGDTAYVTDTATRSIHAIDIATGEITATAELDNTPNEIAVVTG